MPRHSCILDGRRARQRRAVQIFFGWTPEAHRFLKPENGSNGFGVFDTSWKIAHQLNEIFHSGWIALRARAGKEK